MCIPQDRACHVINRLWPEKDHRPVACKWFLNGVLPLDPRLELVVRRQQDGLEMAVAKEARTCAECGCEFYPASNRQRYCPSCGKENERRKAKARRRKAYAKAGKG